MLLFIGKATGESVRKELFQYISCYSLSASTFKNRSEYWRFNTSHVTLYPAHPSTFTVIFAFQYISCYSLSESCCRCFCSYHVSIHLMLLFIPRFIGFSSSNSFYNTAKYKGLQDFYQPTSHFLFTHQNLGITPVFSIFFIFL